MPRLLFWPLTLWALGLLLGGAAPARAEVRHASFVVPAGARVQVSALVDGFTVGLHVDGVEARSLERALLRLRGEKIVLLAPRGNKSLAYVSFHDRVLVARARLGEATAKKSVRVHLEVTTEAPREVLLSRVMDGALPIPRTLETDALAKADEAFVAKRLSEAEMLLSRIKATGLQRPWVMLRLGDLAVFHDQIDRACHNYNEAQANGEMRTASTLAALRSRVLRCQPPPPGKRRLVHPDAIETGGIDWALLLRRSGRDDPIGRHVAGEAQWALGYEQDNKVLASVLALGGSPYRQQLSPSLRAQLLARLLRQSEPFASATQDAAGLDLKDHPEAFDLRLGLGLALCALDLPQDWQPPAPRARSWMTLTPRERARLVREVSACALSGPSSQELQAKATQPEAHLARLRERLWFAEQVLRAQQSLAKPGAQTAAQ